MAIEARNDLEKIGWMKSRNKSNRFIINGEIGPNYKTYRNGPITFDTCNKKMRVHIYSQLVLYSPNREKETKNR